MSEETHRSTRVRRAATLALLAILVYANALPSLFVYDDVSTVTMNKLIRDWRNLPDLFTRAYFAASGEISYRPTVTLSYFVDFALWRLDPAGYHAVNVALHALNALLLYALLQRVFRDRWLAWVAALVFAVHPVATETVNCISYREDALALTFMLAALALYACGMDAALPARAWACALGSLAALALALGAKEMALTTPLLAALVTVLGARRRDVRGKGMFLWACGIGSVLVLALYLAVRFGLMHNPAQVETQLHDLTAPARAALPAMVWSRYASLLLLPRSLRVDHWLTGFEGISAVEAACGLAALLAAVGALLWLTRVNRQALFGLLWLLLSALPVSGLVHLPNPVAERYLYVPLAGLAALAAAVGAHGRGHRRLVMPLALCLVMLAVQRNHAWRDGNALWTAGVREEPKSQRAWHNFGMAYLDRDAARRAVTEFRRTLTRGPISSRFWNNLGAAYAAIPDLDQAEAAYLEALKLDARDFRASFNLSTVYRRKGHLDKAIATIQKTISIFPLNAEAHARLAALYLAQGQHEKAMAECFKSLVIEPTAEVFLNLGNIHLERNDLPEAIRAFQEAARLAPSLADARYNLGLAYERSGMMDGAAYEYGRALAVSPDHVQAHARLAQVHIRLGRLDDARAEFQEVLRLRPFHADALIALAGIHRVKGDKARARECVEKCLAIGQLSPKQAQAVEQELQRQRQADGP